jgi:hypothetical protein
MANNNAVHSRTPLGFGNYKLGEVRGVSLAATGNAIASIPILDGGLTNSGNTATSGAAIVRRITVSNFVSGSLTTANVSVGYTNDGANLVANVQSLSSITANSTYQDLTLSATANTTPVSGNVSSTLYVNLSAGNSASAVVDVSVYGDVLKP